MPRVFASGKDPSHLLGRTTGRRSPKVEANRSRLLNGCIVRPSLPSPTLFHPLFAFTLCLLLGCPALTRSHPGTGSARVLSRRSELEDPAMSTPEMIFAAFLLTVPPGTPENAPSAEQWPVLRDSLQKLSIEWEILDPRETRYILAQAEDFSNDINLLRRRYQDLSDAPRLVDCQRLPDRNVANDLIRFNRAFRKHLDQRCAFETDRVYVLRDVINETEQLYQVWDSVRDARCDFYYVTVRRYALKRLRDTIGQEAFTRGDLPPNVPVWRFNETR